MGQATAQSAIPGIPNDILLYTIIAVGGILFLFFIMLVFNVVILRTISRDLTTGPYYPHEMKKTMSMRTQETEEPKVRKPSGQRMEDEKDFNDAG